MKKVQLAILVILSTFYHGNAQTNNVVEKASELIIGTWQLDTLYLDYEMSENLMSIYKEKFQKMRSSTIINFHADGKYTKQSPNGDRNGTWEYNKDSKLVTIHFEDTDSVDELLIKAISTDKLIAEPQNPHNHNTRIDLIRISK